MKYLLKFFAFALLAAGSARGAAVPKWVYPVDQLDEAMAKAKEEHKGLAFVYTEPGST